MGLPKGSLNKKERGNTQQIFLDAGYDILGYEPGKESYKNLCIENDLEIEPKLCRPQDALRNLVRGWLDIAIIGEDWVKEKSTIRNSSAVRKIGDLDYGKTRLVIGIPKESTYTSLSDLFRANQWRDNPIMFATEYPNLTQNYIMRAPAYVEIFGGQMPLIDDESPTRGKTERVQMIISAGATEGYIELAGADFIVDNTQTGNTLKEYGLRELETEPIIRSSAGLYAGPSCVGWKEEKAQEIFEMLNGAVNARNYFDVKFNSPVEKRNDVINYLIREKLCADEPTVNEGEKFDQVNIMIPRSRFPEVRRTLKKNYGARFIVRNEVKQYIE